jgi:hypothetical protein
VIGRWLLASFFGHDSANDRGRARHQAWEEVAAGTLENPVLSKSEGPNKDRHCNLRLNKYDKETILFRNVVRRVVELIHLYIGSFELKTKTRIRSVRS